MDLLGAVLGMGVGLVAMLAGLLIILKGMEQWSRSREFRHRERMAMIERGLVPSPERDPARFEAHLRGGVVHNRFTSLGIAIVAIGFGLMLMIGFAGGAPDVGVGVGGAIAVLGAAFVLNGWLQGRGRPAVRPPEREPVRPPGNADSRPMD